MKQIKTILQKLVKVRRRKYHPLILHIHKKHKISKKTLFYVKEYGPHSNIPKIIIKESIKVLIFASIISIFGGLMLENIKSLFVTILPLIVLMPVLNDMIGESGIILSSKFSTMLHEGKVKAKSLFTKELKLLFVQVLIISLVSSLISLGIAIAISQFSDYALNLMLFLKLLLIVFIDVLVLVIILFLISIFGGLYFFKKKEDPNNFLIPLTTSIADFGNMLILAVLVVLLF